MWDMFVCFLAVGDVLLMSRTQIEPPDGFTEPVGGMLAGMGCVHCDFQNPSIAFGLESRPFQHADCVCGWVGVVCRCRLFSVSSVSDGRFGKHYPKVV